MGGSRIRTYPARTQRLWRRQVRVLLALTLGVLCSTVPLLASPSAGADEACAPVGSTGICYEPRTRTGIWLRSTSSITREVGLCDAREVNGCAMSVAPVRVPSGSRVFLEAGCEPGALTVQDFTGELRYPVPDCPAIVQTATSTPIVLEVAYTNSTEAWSEARRVPTLWFTRSPGVNRLLPSWVSGPTPKDKTTRGIDLELRRPDGTLEYVERRTHPDLSVISAPLLDVRCDATHPCVGTWTLSAIAFDVDGLVRSVRTLTIAGRDAASATRPSLVSFKRIGPRVRYTRVAPQESKRGKYPWYGVPLKFKAVFDDPDRLLAMVNTDWDEVQGRGPQVLTKGTWKGAKTVRQGSAVDSVRFGRGGRTVFTLEPLFSDARYGCHQVWFTAVRHVAAAGGGRSAVTGARSSVCIQHKR